jgi:uncharacterized cupin superfamily protein
MEEYEVAGTDDVPITDLSENDDIPTDQDMRAVGRALGTEEAAIALWYFEPGEEIGYHAHSEQEELYYVVEGEFSVKIGQPGDAEIVEVGPGDFYAVEPEIGHGHRYLGEDRGVVLAIGAPNVEDPGKVPKTLE